MYASNADDETIDGEMIDDDVVANSQANDDIQDTDDDLKENSTPSKIEDPACSNLPESNDVLKFFTFIMYYLLKKDYYYLLFYSQ